MLDASGRFFLRNICVRSFTVISFGINLAAESMQNKTISLKTDLLQTELCSTVKNANSSRILEGNALKFGVKIPNFDSKKIIRMNF